MSSGQDYGNRLREEIRRAMGEHLSSAASEIQALRDTIASSLERLSHSLESTQGLALPGAEQLLADALRESETSGGNVPALLAEHSRQIRTKETQEDILELLLDAAHDFAPGAALFVSRGDKLVAWSSRGYGTDVTRRLKNLDLGTSESQVLRRALNEQSPQMIGDLAGERSLTEVLGGEAGPPWHAIPLRALGRSLAVLLVSSKADRACDLVPISVIVDSTELCIENLALKILQELSVSGAPAAARTEEAVQVAEEAGPVAAEPPVTEEAPESAEAPEEVPPPDEAVSAAPEEGPAALPEQTPVPEAAFAPEEPASEEAGAVMRAEPAPEPLRDTSEEEKLHSDAKRFARLLVDEIKLYNEQRVVEGRQNSDLYLRLKRDIDRSRDMYEKRVAPAITRKADYFHDELIRILGENDLTKLGSDYPGPRVER